MVSGYQIRLNRILKNNKMLCIPMDHGISNGPISGIEDPHSIIYKCQNHGITSIIINKGIIKSLPHTIKVGILVHYSASTSLSTHPDRKVLLGTVKEALRLGADGVSIHVNIGGKEEAEMLKQLGAISEQCHEWNMPLLAMMYPRGENISNPLDPDIIAHVSRIGAECGADIVKTLYPGEMNAFKKIIKSTPVPIVVAGGPKANNIKDILNMTEDVMKAGAIGITYGRNIFSYNSPEKIVRALASIIFKKLTAKDAVKIVQ